MHFTAVHTLLSALDQLESIPGSEITPSSVKTPGRLFHRFCQLLFPFFFGGGVWGHSKPEWLVALRSSPNVRLPSAPSVRGWQRVDGRRWEPNGQIQSHYMTGDFIDTPPHPPPPIRELGGSLAHICDVWKPDSASMSAQAQRAHAGPPKVQTWRLHEGWDAHAQERKDYQSFFHTLDVSGFGKERKSGHPTR